MQNLSLPELPSPLVVAAHDAGAANLIIGWLRNRPSLQLRLCLDGPAAQLWSCAFGDWTSTTLENALHDAAALISGTSHASELEHQARNLAQHRQIHSIGVIDHWVNYPQRFIRNGQTVLPDEIWVTDADALAIATAHFPGIPLRQHPNLYLADLVAQVQKASHNRTAHKQRVLYALEPIRAPWASINSPGEFLALDYFIAHGPSLGLNKDCEIRLRPHPSDPPGKYDNWIKKQPGWDLHIDSSVSLAHSIAWSDTVVGCETYALVVGLAAGKRVVSTLPPQAPQCRLPMKNLVHLRDLSH